MNGILVVFMVTQERMGPPEIVVIYFASTTITIEKHCQSIALHHSTIFFFVSSRNGKARCMTRQNGCIRDQFPARSVDYCVVTKGDSPIEKRCVTEQRTAEKSARI